MGINTYAVEIKPPYIRRRHRSHCELGWGRLTEVSNSVGQINGSKTQFMRNVAVSDRINLNF